MTKDEIRAALEDAGIEHDARWSVDTLEALLPTAPKNETIPCTVMRDYWTAEGHRVRAGTIVDVEPMKALEGVESGILARVK